MSVQCCVMVFNRRTKRFRHCRGYGRIYGKQMGYCRCHIEHYYATIIQTNWRRYKIFRNMKVFKHLPGDVWNMVLNNIEPTYSIQFLRSALKIYQTRYSDSYQKYHRRMISREEKNKLVEEYCINREKYIQICTHIKAWERYHK
jgi:hypothetical protein